MKIYELCQQGELVIRIIIAALIGCMIGYERKNREKSAGLRTQDRKSTRLNSSHTDISRMPSSA